MLYFNNFRKSYGQNLVLAIDDLTIDNGIYWVKGVNGSGKSTLLKSIGGFLFFNGDIILDGINMKQRGVDYRKKVNFADAEPLYPEFLTGWEMISLFKKAKGGDIGQERYYVESMQMEGYLNNPLGTYSSGMLKKLSLVLAFLGNSSLILLDEPLITIDAESLKVLYEWIVKKHIADNVTFLLSSHQPLDGALLPQAKELLVISRTLNYNS